MSSKIIVGLTGGLGSGKSTVAKVFCQFGFEYIDSDSLSKSFLEKESIIESLYKTFGDKILTENKIDKQTLRDIVFSSLQNIKKINEIMWPPVKQRIAEILQNTKNSCCLECALLFESGLNCLVDKVVTVSCALQNRRERIIARDGTDKFFDVILSAQWTDFEREEKSDYVVNNIGNIAHLKSAAKSVVSALKY
ncbi:MAG: dephospho-CoA kinase [Clostridiales bacterium]|jgi:dephospho-CoA kinase|nr:dephospho-CoA kinase [Clostridiales bacterium]